MPRPPYPLEIISGKPLTGIWVGRSCSRRCTEKTNLLSLAGTETRFLDSRARSFVTLPTTLYQLPHGVQQYKEHKTSNLTTSHTGYSSFPTP